MVNNPAATPVDWAAHLYDQAVCLYRCEGPLKAVIAVAALSLAEGSDLFDGLESPEKRIEAPRQHPARVLAASAECALELAPPAPGVESHAEPMDWVYYVGRAADVMVAYALAGVGTARSDRLAPSGSHELSRAQVVELVDLPASQAADDVPSAYVRFLAGPKEGETEPHPLASLVSGHDALTQAERGDFQIHR